MQDVAPAVEYVPATQFTQLVTDVAEIVADAVPAAQLVQDAAPAEE